MDPVGVDAVRAFINLHHHGAHLPREDIFAFVANCDTEDETYVMVSERDQRLDIVGASCVGELGISDTRFDQLQDAAADEATACGIDAPFAVTFSTQNGVFSYPFHRQCKRTRRLRALCGA